MKSINFQILSSFFFSLLGLEIKIVSTNLNIETIIFYRCLIGSVIIFSMIIIFLPNKKLLKTNNFKYQFLRAFCGTLAMFFGYSALTFITLAEASTISFTKIFFVFLLSSLFLKENLSLPKIYLSILGFCGVFLLSSAEIPSKNLGTFMAIVGTFFVASGIILMSYMSKRDHTLTILFYHSFLSCLISGMIFFNKIILPPPDNFFLLLMITITALLGQYFNTESYKKNSANYIILFGYTRIIFSILFGYFFLEESLIKNQFIGLILVVITTMLGAKIKK